MSGWKQIRYTIGFNGISDAYRDSRNAFEAEIARWEARWAAHREDVAAGRAETEQVDEDTGWVFDFGEHVGEQIYEAEEGLRLIREAFVLILYHFWEKRACELLGLKKYEVAKVYKLAAADPTLGFQEAGIERLRRLANCIKHDNGRDLYLLAPNIFDPALAPQDKTDTQGWHQALRLTEDELAAAFAAVRASGPKPRGTAVVDEISL